VNDLAKKTHAVAEALAASIYNVSGIDTAFSGSLVSIPFPFRCLTFTITNYNTKFPTIMYFLSVLNL